MFPVVMVERQESTILSHFLEKNPEFRFFLNNLSRYFSVLTASADVLFEIKHVLLWHTLY